MKKIAKREKKKAKKAHKVIAPKKSKPAKKPIKKKNKIELLDHYDP